MSVSASRSVQRRGEHERRGEFLLQGAVTGQSQHCSYDGREEESLPVPCDSQILKDVPLFSLLDDDERSVLSSHVDVREFGPNQRIYKIGEPGGRAYVVARGRARVTTID